ncbi:MAG: serine/threonine protein kinase [Lachnospiraceae bacterium]|nr:serine/threonine protein kinase [Lachnospiraceae bacterium]
MGYVEETKELVADPSGVQSRPQSVERVQEESPKAQGTLEIGSLVDGKYKILRVVGRGGMSVVYMAINEKANKTWAIKEARRDGSMNYEAVRQSLSVETKLLKRLHHPNIVSIVDVIEDKDSFLIVMDYIEGNSLKERLEEQGAQPQEDVIKWAKQLCSVLSYLHGLDPPVIYRDMKPANIMLKPDGNVCVMDFGIAREYKQRNREDTVSLGTYGYAAWEQYEGAGGGQTDARTDIYNLGATMFHLVTGVDLTNPHNHIVPIRQINPALSSGLEQIIEKCTMHEKEERYQSCDELLVDLENVDKMDVGYRKKQKVKLTAFLLTAILAVLLLVGGIGTSAAASRQASNNYEELLAQAEISNDYDYQLECYQNAIGVADKAGETEAYLQMIDLFESYYDDDDTFTATEEDILISLITQNEAELMENTEDYVDLCFEVGKLYWYYYDCGEGGENQVTRAKYSVKWFEKVINAVGENGTYDNLGMATVYSEIGNFYKQVAKNITQSEDTGTYAPFFENLSMLMEEIATDTGEKENVRLELCALTQKAMLQYATKFKVDGVAYDDMISLYNQLKSCLETIQTVAGSTPDDTKNEISEALEDTLAAINLAYGL